MHISNHAEILVELNMHLSPVWCAFQTPAFLSKDDS